jgi:DNA-binding MarR family transcriptional regulator
MTKIDAAKTWALNYRLLMSVIRSVADEIAGPGLETKDLFLLAELEEHPHPAELASVLLMPKPSVTVAVKRLEAAGFVRRAIDTEDLRRHRLTVTPAGKRAATRGLAMLSEAFGARLGRLTKGEQAQLVALLEKMAGEGEE